MDTHNETSTRDADGAFDRRRLLQGAVAAGVGAVAWTSPSISSLGGTPAYAAVCTGGSQEFVLDYRNTACNCGKVNDPGGKYVSYKIPDNTQQCPVDNVVPREVTFWKGNKESYGLIDNSGTCPPNPVGDPAGAYARIKSIGSANDFQFCRLKVSSVKNNCSNVILATAYSDIVPINTTQFVAMPRVPCQGEGNIFLRVALECANDDACLV